MKAKDSRLRKKVDGRSLKYDMSYNYNNVFFAWQSPQKGLIPQKGDVHESWRQISRIIG